MRIQLVDVERISTLMHVGVVVVAMTAYQVAVDLNSLSAVPLLSVQLPTFSTVSHIDWLNEKSSLVFVMIMCMVVAMVPGVSLLSNHCLPCGVEPKVSLSHQLLVEGSIHSTILVEILR
jgi:hypothetical protein